MKKTKSGMPIVGYVVVGYGEDVVAECNGAYLAVEEVIAAAETDDWETVDVYGLVKVGVIRKVPRKLESE